MEAALETGGKTGRNKSHEVLQYLLSIGGKLVRPQAVEEATYSIPKDVYHEHEAAIEACRVAMERLTKCNANVSKAAQVLKESQ